MKQQRNNLIFSKEEASKIFFTSDTHFGHSKIIEYCDRPYLNTDDMNERLIENWNNTIKEDDYVFHLGDFALGGSSTWESILPRLNGHKILIKGNHDHQNFRDKYAEYFEYVAEQMLIFIDDIPVLLNHYPILCYPKKYKSSDVIQLHGHVHSAPHNKGEDKCHYALHSLRQYDVGVDNNNYTPVGFYEICDIINRRENNYGFMDKLKQLYNCFKWLNS